MERFEIALSLDDEQLLIPSMLPKEKPGMQLHQLQKLIRKRANTKVCKFSAVCHYIFIPYDTRKPPQVIQILRS